MSVKSQKNSNLSKARASKNDEFYTQLTDIEKELRHYKDHFRGKTVFCNCDDPKESNFWLYFSLNFDFLGLKKLISTHYDATQPTYKLERAGPKDTDVVRTDLRQNGDFRSDECVALLDEADIVVTNPPFSLFRPYIAQLMERNKHFIVIGNVNAITYKEIFPYIKDNHLWLGVSPRSMTFKNPDGQSESVNACWFTNLRHKKRNEPVELYRKYYGNEDNYPLYDNYDAIEVNKVADIPYDYEGVMGVPITFLDKYNPTQFNIIGGDGFFETPPKKIYGKKTKIVNHKEMKSQTGTMGCVIKMDAFGEGVYFDVGYPVKAVYKRIFIKNRNPQ